MVRTSLQQLSSLFNEWEGEWAPSLEAACIDI